MIKPIEVIAIVLFMTTALMGIHTYSVTRPKPYVFATIDATDSRTGLGLSPECPDGMTVADNEINRLRIDTYNATLGKGYADAINMIQALECEKDQPDR